MFTGISGSNTLEIASITAVSVIIGAVSPSGVQLPWGWLMAFTARLPRAIQGSDQRVPWQRRAFHPGWVFVNSRERLEPLQRFVEPGVVLGALPRAHHLPERFKQRARIGFAAASHRFGHQIGGRDADRATARLEPGLGDLAVGVELNKHLDPVAAHRVVALGGDVISGEAMAVPRLAAMIQNDFLIQVANVVVERHVKNSRTRVSDAASASISSCVV